MSHKLTVAIQQFVRVKWKRNWDEISANIEQSPENNHKQHFQHLVQRQ
jgi:hypothetical protein